MNTTEHPLAIPMLGRRFGRWLVVDRASNGPHSSRRYLCRCDCGTEKIKYGISLRQGTSQGCRRCAANPGRKPTHGHARRQGRTSEYGIWKTMRSRCYNPNVKEYPNYGGRGITVCETWRRSFESFLEDVGPRPSPQHSIDRIDNDGNYEPGNCRWATSLEQNNNSRRHTRVLVAGKLLTIPQAALHFGVPYKKLANSYRNCLDINLAAQRCASGQ